ncbi:MAG: hypothetical protein U0269_23470 [Polyangiales bacterium]
MDRRRFLSTSTVAASAAALGAGASLEGCASTGFQFDPLLHGLDVRALVERLERGVRRLREHPAGTIVRGPSSARPALTEHVLRQTLESLMALDVIRSASDRGAIPPALARALEPMLPSLDQCTHTHHALLRAMPASERRLFDQRVRAQPELVMNAIEWVDERAAELGVPTDNRLRLRHAAVTTGTRIRRQSTGAVIDDCVAQLDQMIDRFDLQLPPALLSATNAVATAMWRSDHGGASDDRLACSRAKNQRSDPASLAVAGSTIVAVPERFGTPEEMPFPTEPVQWSAYWASPGDWHVRTGAILAPFGLITCGVTLIIGIVLLAIGASRNNNWNGRTTQASEAAGPR